MAHPYWHLFDLRIRTPRVEIRLATDEDLVELARVASQGIHDPAEMPFLKPWTDDASPDLERGVMQWGWRHRAQWKPDDWTFNGVVIADGQIVGVQDLAGANFSILRTVRTGSWLGRRYQGVGIGKEMRAAILHLAFAGLDALEAKSGANAGNPASLGVSRSLGYVDDGQCYELRRAERTRQLHLSLSRDSWQQHRRSDIVLEGLDVCLEMFGVTPDGT